MQVRDYSHLKSGTDVRGYASGENLNLTDEAVYDICRSFIKFIADKLKKERLKLAVGHDVRISCPRILNQVKKAAADSGCDLVYTGLSSTPSMFMLLKDSSFGCDASVMITASHLPSDRNGLKFFTSEGGLEGKDIERILNSAGLREHVKLSGGSYAEKSFMPAYCDSLVGYVRRSCGKEQPLKGKKIIVDAGNGAGGFFADSVLKPLGADTSGSIYLQPDGTFPNHIPNPEDKSAIDALCKAVIREKADLGIIFDTDVDRAGAVDGDGSEINRNRLIALLSAILLAEKSGTIVTDSVTSDSLAEFIKARGGKHVRFKRGYKNVINEAIRRNSEGEYTPLAIETSGHAAFKDNYFLDDGAYLITRLLICLSSQAESGKRLSDLIGSLKAPEEEKEVRIGFNSSSVDFKTEGSAVIEELKLSIEKDGDLVLAPDNYEGVRFNSKAADGWTLLRMSVHDPVMPINFESNLRGGNKIMAKKLYELLKNYSFLDCSKLYEFIKEG